MAGLTTAVRNIFFNACYNGTAVALADVEITEWALVTSATGNTAGGAIANEVGLTGYARAAHTAGLFGSPTDGTDASDAVLSFGTVPQGSGSATATHAVGLNAAENVVDVAQLTNAGGTASAPLVIDSTSGDVTVTIPASQLIPDITDTADVA